MLYIQKSLWWDLSSIMKNYYNSSTWMLLTWSLGKKNYLLGVFTISIVSVLTYKSATLWYVSSYIFFTHPEYFKLRWKIFIRSDSQYFNCNVFIFIDISKSSKSDSKIERKKGNIYFYFYQSVKYQVSMIFQSNPT